MRALVSRLPPRQRAAVVPREGLDWSAPEIAQLLGTSPAAVNSGARATLGEPGELPVLDDFHRALLTRYLHALRHQGVGRPGAPSAHGRRPHLAGPGSAAHAVIPARFASR